MAGVWKEQRVQHVAHIIQGLFYRGVDSPTLKKLFSKVEQLVTIALGPWHGADAFEGRMKALTALTTCVSTQWVWDESKPKAKALRRTSDAVFKEVCGGRIQKALQNPPADSRYYKTAVLPSMEKEGPVGVVRLKILDFIGTVLKVQFLSDYEEMLCNSGIILDSLELFFKYKHNFFLHTTVLSKVIIPALSSPSDAILENLLVSCNLLQRIIDGYQPPSAPRSGTPDSYVSYNGHLTYLSNEINESGLLESTIIMKKLPSTTRANWNKFSSTTLADTLAIQASQ